MSSQPQRLGRPVVAPNSFPRARETFTHIVVEFGRKRSGANPRGIGLAHSEHVTDVARTEPTAGGSSARRGIGRRHERKGALIDVQATPPCAPSSSMPSPRVESPHAASPAHPSPSARCAPRPASSESRTSVMSTGLVPNHRVSTKLWNSSSARSFASSLAGVEQIHRRASPGERPCPRTRDRCRARWCRSRPNRARPRARGSSAAW